MFRLNAVKSIIASKNLLQESNHAGTHAPKRQRLGLESLSERWLMAVQAIAMANVQTYLNRIDQLYADVRNWMAALEPSARFSESEIELAEQATGAYRAKRLEITRPGRHSLSLTPRGRYMVGAEGRVDVHGWLGREILVWVRADAPALGFRF
ncbi:MAG TPA: hypothetical protein PK867_03220, partial [Pirellulales bacterium]|nr:hypothetical protein [Pirellulales bacterium]